MRIEHNTITECFTIYDAPMPANRGVQDPITVVLRDFGGSGQIIVECYGSAWSHWFGAIGTKSLRAFIAQCHACYLADKLCSNTSQPFNKRTENWVERISNHVVKALAAAVVQP